jgi:hypothetical protein
MEKSTPLMIMAKGAQKLRFQRAKIGMIKAGISPARINRNGTLDAGNNEYTYLIFIKSGALMVP